MSNIQNEEYNDEIEITKKTIQTIQKLTLKNEKIMDDLKTDLIQQFKHLEDDDKPEFLTEFPNSIKIQSGTLQKINEIVKNHELKTQEVQEKFLKKLSDL